MLGSLEGTKVGVSVVGLAVKGLAVGVAVVGVRVRFAIESFAIGLEVGVAVEGLAAGLRVGVGLIVGLEFTGVLVDILGGLVVGI